MFEFLLCAEAPPGPLSRGHVLPSFGQFFLPIFGNCKNSNMCDGLVIEKLVLKFGRNRPRNNEVKTIINIW